MAILPSIWSKSNSKFKSGNGKFLLGMARNDSSVNFLGLESNEKVGKSSVANSKILFKLLMPNLISACPALSAFCPTIRNEKCVCILPY